MHAARPDDDLDPMRHSASALLLLAALATPAAAQTYHSTLPDGYLKKSGDWWMTGVGFPFAAGLGRYQEVHDDWSGSARTLKGVAFRRAWGLPTNTSAVARTVSVFFRVGYGDVSKFGTGSSIDANFTSSRTTVVGTESPAGISPAVVKLPDWTALDPKWSQGNPAPFSAILPFSTSFVHDGKTDFVWDVEIVKTSSTGALYHFDRAAVGQGNYSLSQYEPLPLLDAGSCHDSSATGTFPARITGSAVSYDKTYPGTTLADTTRISVTSFSTAPNATVIHAIGFPSIAGIQIGAKCYGLHVDTAQPHLLSYQTTFNSGSGYSPTTYWSAPNSATSSLIGTRFAVQAAWTDSSTKQLGLSQGVTFLMPGQSRPVHTKYVYASAGSATQGPYTAGSVITGWY